MASLITIDGSGVRAASLAEVVAEVHRRYRERLGEDLALAPQTPQAQIAGITAAVTAEVIEAIVEDVNANSVDHAGGLLLAQLGSILGVERLQSTRSRVTLTLFGVGGTGVPAGSRVQNADGAVFETLEAVILTPDGVSVGAQAVEAGPVEAEADTLTERVTIIPGWERVTNDAEAALGIQGQSDQDYRLVYEARTGRVAAGVESAIRAAIEEAGGKKQRIVENRTNQTVTTQQWPVFGHSIAVVAEDGSTADITRSVELRRGQGVGTMAAIIGGAPNNSDLDSVNAGAIQWNGAPFTGLDLTSATTDADKAAALTTLLANSDPPVLIRAIDGLYFAFYAWEPGEQPAFAEVSTGTVAANFGLLAGTATAAPGPFGRARQRDLIISATIVRRAGFPGDGLTRIRTAISGIVSGYDIGQEVWSNDILAAVETIPGTRATALTVQHDGADASGVAVPLDSQWRLPANNLTVNVT